MGHASVCVAGTNFCELIERCQQITGFGEGNFRALLEASEREHHKRGSVGVNENYFSPPNPHYCQGQARDCLHAKACVQRRKLLISQRTKNVTIVANRSGVMPMEVI